MIEMLEHNNYIKSLIEICKSNSGSIGSQLRESHYELGKCLALQTSLYNYRENSTILSLARAGLPFSFGIADVLNSSLLILDEKDSKLWSCKTKDYNDYIFHNMNSIENKNIIIVDAVINTGATIINIINELNNFIKKTIIATNVIQDSAIKIFNNYDLYAVRSSANSFKGSKVSKQIDGYGPDTGDRLFNTMK